MGRYKEEMSDSSFADFILTIATGWIPALFGAIPTTYETRIADKETRKQGVGYGYSKGESHAAARRDLKGK